LLLSVHLTAATLSQIAFQRLATQASTVTASTVTNQTRVATSHSIVIWGTATGPAKGGTNAIPAAPFVTMGGPTGPVALAVAAAVATALSTAGNLLAICWFGMWMGMTSRSPNLATLKTITFVQVIPWFALSFVTGMLAAALMSAFVFRASSPRPTAWFVWWPLLTVVVSAALAVAKDIGFIVWSRNKLRSSFREEAARSLGQPRVIAIPLVPAAASAPTVVAAPR